MVRDHTLHGFNSLKFVEVFFVVQDMVCLGLCFLGI